MIILFLCASNDSFAYICGKSCGKNKLFKASPNKTVEGFVCGIIFGSLSSLLLIYVLNWTGLHVIKWKWIYEDYGIHLFFWLIFLSIIANLGDLFFSWQKRLLNKKDFGNILGPHGGFWDRFDSHAFVLISVFLIHFVVQMH